MKALSLWQPWASLVAFGEKRVETRSWHTNYRGPLAIHAAKRFGKGQAFLLAREPFRSVLRRNGIILPSQLPLGAIVATCELVSCFKVDYWTDRFTEQEYALGDYAPGRYAWILKDIKRIGPIPYRGHQGLWDWNNEAKR